MSLEGYKTLILTEERQYIRENERFWTEVRGSVPTFVGRVSTLPNGSPLQLTISLPELYPWEKPRVTVDANISDPRVMPDGSLLLDVLENWDGARHRMKDIIFEARRYFNDPSRKRSYQQVNFVPTSPVAESGRIPELRSEITSLQTKIAELDTQIQTKKEAAMNRAGGGVSTLTLSPEKELQSNLQAVDDLLNLLESFFENMEVDVMDYLSQKVKYMKRKFRLKLALANKIPADKVETSLSSKITRGVDEWSIQTDLYGFITRIDTLVRVYNMGMLQEELYEKQVTNAINKVLDLSNKMHNGYNIEKFYDEYDIHNTFPEAAKRLNFIEGGIRPALGTLKPKDLLLVKEISSTRITLQDLLLLRNYATYSAVTTKLMKLLQAFIDMPAVGKDHELTSAVRGWYDKLDREMRETDPETKLPVEHIDQLLHDLGIWEEQFDALIRRL